MNKVARKILPLIMTTTIVACNSGGGGSSAGTPTTIINWNIVSQTAYSDIAMANNIVYQNNDQQVCGYYGGGWQCGDLLPQQGPYKSFFSSSLAATGSDVIYSIVNYESIAAYSTSQQKFTSFITINGGWQDALPPKQYYAAYANGNLYLADDKLYIVNVASHSVTQVYNLPSVAVGQITVDNTGNLYYPAQNALYKVNLANGSASQYTVGSNFNAVYFDNLTNNLYVCTMNSVGYYNLGNYYSLPSTTQTGSDSTGCNSIGVGQNSIYSNAYTTYNNINHIVLFELSR